MDGETSVLALLLHHIAMDEWSDRPLLRDLTTAYAARRAGTAPAWAPLPVQYADYALGLAESPADVDFWRSALDGLPDEITLPADRPRTGRRAPAGVEETTLPAALVDPIRELARGESASVFMALHAALAVLLSRHGAGDDVPIGTPTSGRGDAALDDLVGFFVNTVVLRADLSGNPGFAGLLRRVRAADLAAVEHAGLPFQQVVELVNPRRRAGRNPLFQVLIGYFPRPSPDGGVLGLPVLPAPRLAADPKVDLNFTFVDGGPDGVELSCEYDTTRFDAGTVRRLLDRLAVLLAAIAADPAAGVRDLPILAPADQVALDRWATGGPGVVHSSALSTGHPGTPPRSPNFSAIMTSGGSPREGGVGVGVGVRRRSASGGVGEWADSTVGRTGAREQGHHLAGADPQADAEPVEPDPDAEALVCGGVRMTYRELDRASDAVAAMLAARGVGADDVVGIALPRSADLVVAVLGVAKAGAAYLPLDPSFPAARLDFMIADARPTVVLRDLAGLPDAAGADGRPAVRGRRVRDLHLRFHRPAQGRGGHPPRPGGVPRGVAGRAGGAAARGYHAVVRHLGAGTARPAAGRRHGGARLRRRGARPGAAGRG